MLTGKLFTCPDCSKSYTYRLTTSVSICCTGCGNVYSVEKNGNILNEEMNCKIASDDKLLISIGATGTFNGEPFNIIGRIRSVTNLSISNEWVMWFEKTNSFKWLIESGLTYFVFESATFPITASVLKSQSPGSVIQLDNDSYVITEAARQIQFKMEGEIPEESLNVKDFLKIELTKSYGKKFASICVYSKDAVDVTYGQLINITDLKLSTITKFSDWL